MNFRGVSAKKNRGRKLLSVLLKRHRKGCNISQLESEFSEDCFGLVPHVLACIHAYSLYDPTYGHVPLIQCNSLSFLFELLRGWKMPEMYQFRSK